MKLNEIAQPKNAVKRRKRVGRGESSGMGKTSGKGNKGQKARAGGFHKRGFEGGQMPLQRRLPKRGFTSLQRKDHVLLNVGQLAALAKDHKISLALLRELGCIKGRCDDGLKILGGGDLQTALTVEAAGFSASAKTKIEQAGGTIIQTKGA